MKGYSLVLIGLIMLFSCSENKKPPQVKYQKCLPAFAMIVCLQKENKPKYPLIIRTNKNDTSYLNVIGSDKEKLDRNGFTTSKEYLRVSAINIEGYSKMKNYIIAHNTHKDRTVFNADNNTIRIMLVDKCDTLSYAVDKTDKEYFSKMIDALNLEPDDELRGFIYYYHEIQKWDSSAQRSNNKF